MQYNGGLAQWSLRRLGGGGPELDSHQVQEIMIVCRAMAEARASVSLGVEFCASTAGSEDETACFGVDFGASTLKGSG